MLINVCGDIASGKSTLVAALQDRFRIPAVLEELPRISLFDRYCQDPSNWAARTQVQFLMDKSTRALSQVYDHPTLLDRSFAEDANIFARLHKDIGNISAAEYETYMSIYEGIMSFMPNKEFNIYVDCSFKGRVERIKNRSVEERKMLTKSYLKTIAREYSSFRKTKKFDLVYDSETQNPLEIANELENLLGKS